MINIKYNSGSSPAGGIKIERLTPLQANVGILGVGHRNYWAQFDGLLDKLNKKLQVFAEMVKREGVNTHLFGISDSAETAYKLAVEIKSADLDLLFIDMVTYATSSTVAAIFREVNVPVVLVALQPDKALDYEKATTYMQLYNDDICAIPEFTSVAQRMGKPDSEDRDRNLIR